MPTLADIVTNQTGSVPATPELATRSLTGKERHPLILLSGGYKVGKSWSIAAASADPRVARMRVIEVGRDAGAMDEYGAIPGSRVELIEHDGTWAGVAAQIQAACADPRPENQGYNVLSIDGATSLWALLSRTAQAGGRDIGPGGWAALNATWDDLLDVLRTHDGPVILTARVDGDNLAGDDLSKVRVQKDLPYDVDVVVQASGHRTFNLRGVRSIRFKGVSGTVEIGDLVIPDLLDLLTGAASL